MPEDVPATDVAMLFDRAAEAHAADRVESALEGYLQVLELAPDHVATLIHVAHVYLRFDRQRDAELVLQRLAASDDETLIASIAGLPEANLVFAGFCTGAGQPALADRILAKALRLWPDDPALNEAVGQRLADEGQYDAAEAYFRHALSVAPDRASTRLSQAELRVRQRDIAGALEILLDLLELEPGNSDAVRRAIAVIEDGVHDADLAAHFLHRLAELIEEDGEALAYIGFKMLADERFEGALAAFARASDLDLDTHETLIGSGTAAYGLGEERAAESYWLQGLAAIPDDAGAWLAVVETFAHDLPRGMLRRLVDGAAKRAEASPEELSRVAEFACQLTLHDLASEIVERALALRPGNVRSLEIKAALDRFKKD